MVDFPLAAVGVEDLRQAEVHELDSAVLREDGVRGLDVPVEDAAPVRRGEAPREPYRELQDLAPRHRPRELVEAHSGHELPGDEPPAVDLSDAVNRRDVWVLDARGRAGLVEIGRLRRLERLVVSQDLDRDGPVEERVVAEVDFPHPAAPERLDQPEFADHLHRGPRPIRGRDRGGARRGSRGGGEVGGGAGHGRGSQGERNWSVPVRGPAARVNFQLPLRAERTGVWSGFGQVAGEGAASPGEGQRPHPFTR